MNLQSFLEYRKKNNKGGLLDVKLENLLKKNDDVKKKQDISYLNTSKKDEMENINAISNINSMIENNNTSNYNINNVSKDLYNIFNNQSISNNINTDTASNNFNINSISPIKTTKHNNKNNNNFEVDYELLTDKTGIIVDEEKYVLPNFDMKNYNHDDRIKKSIQELSGIFGSKSKREAGKENNICDINLNNLTIMTDMTDVTEESIASVKNKDNRNNDANTTQGNNLFTEIKNQPQDNSEYKKLLNGKVGSLGDDVIKNEKSSIINNLSLDNNKNNDRNRLIQLLEKYQIKNVENNKDYDELNSKLYTETSNANNTINSNVKDNYDIFDSYDSNANSNNTSFNKSKKNTIDKNKNIMHSNTKQTSISDFMTKSSKNPVIKNNKEHSVATVINLNLKENNDNIALNARKDELDKVKSQLIERKINPLKNRLNNIDNFVNAKPDRDKILNYYEKDYTNTHVPYSKKQIDKFNQEISYTDFKEKINEMKMLNKKRDHDKKESAKESINNNKTETEKEKEERLNDIKNKIISSRGRINNGKNVNRHFMEDIFDISKTGLSKFDDDLNKNNNVDDDFNDLFGLSSKSKLGLPSINYINNGNSHQTNSNNTPNKDNAKTDYLNNKKFMIDNPDKYDYVNIKKEDFYSNVLNKEFYIDKDFLKKRIKLPLLFSCNKEYIFKFITCLDYEIRASLKSSCSDSCGSKDYFKYKKDNLRFKLISSKRVNDYISSYQVAVNKDSKVLFDNYFFKDNDLLILVESNSICNSNVNIKESYNHKDNKENKDNKDNTFHSNSNKYDSNEFYKLGDKRTKLVVVKYLKNNAYNSNSLEFSLWTLEAKDDQSNSNFSGLSKTKEYQIFYVSSLTSMYREYTALVELNHLKYVLISYINKPTDYYKNNHIDFPYSSKISSKILCNNNIETKESKNNNNNIIDNDLNTKEKIDNEANKEAEAFQSISKYLDYNKEKNIYNSSQLNAIKQSVTLKKNKFLLIQGPPGTGKTHTIMGILSSIFILNKNSKILVCAPSNTAVDEILIRADKYMLKNENGDKFLPEILRFGYQEKSKNADRDDAAYSLDKRLSKYTLDYKVENDMIKNQISSIQVESDKKIIESSRIRNQIKQLEKELKEITDEIVEDKNKHNNNRRNSKIENNNKNEKKCDSNDYLEEGEIRYNNVGENKKNDEEFINNLINDCKDQKQTYEDIIGVRKLGVKNDTNIVIKDSNQDGNKDSSNKDSNQDINQDSNKESKKETEYKIPPLLKQKSILIQSKLKELTIQKSKIEDYIKTLLDKKQDQKYNKKKEEINIIKKANIVFTTLNSSGNEKLKILGVSYDYLIVDEACQATEPSCLIPLYLQVNRIILVGDHMQLPATLFSEGSSHFGYNKSLFERLVDAEHPRIMLNVQYRMHERIGKVISRLFYDNNLKTYYSNDHRINNKDNKNNKEEIKERDNDKETKEATNIKDDDVFEAYSDSRNSSKMEIDDILLSSNGDRKEKLDLNSNTQTSEVNNSFTSKKKQKQLENIVISTHINLKTPTSIFNHIFNQKTNFSFFNTSSGLETKQNSSYFNKKECEYIISFLLQLTKKLRNMNLEKPDFTIGIISPYKEQVREIQNSISQNCNKKGINNISANLKKVIKVQTVDSFQGKEEDIIIISCVRSTNLGFLTDFRRLNVAVSRAKSNCYIFGNISCLKRDEYWKKVISYCENEIKTKYDIKREEDYLNYVDKSILL